MIESIGQRLRIVLHGHGGPPGSEASGLPQHTGRELEFVAYGEDCVLSGFVRMNAERLSDMLNAHDEYLLTDVLLERLDDGGTTDVKEVLVHRAEVLLIHATGPRGSASQRRRTRAHPVALRVGEYSIRGYLHALPGADPIQEIPRRETMIPLTDAWIEYQSGAERHRRRVGTVVLNRERIAWIVPATIEEVEMPDTPLKADRGSRLKGFTGASFDRS